MHLLRRACLPATAAGVAELSCCPALSTGRESSFGQIRKLHIHQRPLSSATGELIAVSKGWKGGDTWGSKGVTLQAGQMVDLIVAALIHSSILVCRIPL